MAKLIANRVQNCEVMAFTDSLSRVENANGIKTAETFSGVLREASKLHTGGTDCSVPFQAMNQAKIKADVIIMFTDYESWAGRNGHTSQLLKMYRSTINKDAKVVYVTLAPNDGYTLMDPEDKLSLDIAGFNSDVVKMIADFSNNLL